jgi:2-polyprenyl-3-methyl-5-hydroxy-6-metoxy-1,4-benzoquinol methylase
MGVIGMKLPKIPGTVRKALWKLLPYRPDRVSHGHYERLYASGSLDWYKDLSELARYSVVIGYCHYFKPSGAILDVGCGEGILQERLEPNTYTQYVGVDSSNTAIRRAAERQDEKTSFVMADFNTYVPSEQFDIIIFNECLYHADDPLGLVKRYESFLKDDGLFIVSICDHERVKKVWKILEAAYPVGDEVRISHLSTFSWTIKTLIPSRNLTHPCLRDYMYSARTYGDDDSRQCTDDDAPCA